MTRTSLLKFVAFVFAVLTLNLSQAQQRPILLKNATIQLEQNSQEFLDERIPYSNTFRGKAFRLMQFDHVLLSAEKAALESAGFEILEYIPHNAYVVSFAVSANRAVLLEYGANSVVDLGPAFKVNAKLHTAPYPEHAVKGSAIRVVFQVHKNLHWNEVEGALTQLGTKITSTGPSDRLLRGWIPQDKIAFFGSLPFISQLEADGEPGVPEALDGKSLHRSTKINTEYAGGLSYDGTGVSIAINDDGFVGPHIDFNGRTDQTDVAGDLTGDHGDMTAGIAGGAGNIDPTVVGMAPGAFVWVRQYNANLPNVVSLHLNDGVMAFSSSYSNGCNDGYTALTQQVDDEIFDNTAIFQSFSAGNANGSNCGYGAGNQWGNITGGHKIAKNVTAAANLRYNEIIETSSSRGPAADGRIKPDIAAHGTAQMSLDPNYSYGPGGGTSAACPGITGVFAQLVEAYRDHNSGNNPESGLIKACMLNTAFDLGNEGPDFIFGWGRVNTAGAYNIIEQVQYVTDGIDQGDNSTHNLTIPAGTEEVRMMLYWMDPPASTAASKALVNDLDLTVIGPGATVYEPWILDPTPNPVTLDLPATTGVDTLNNMEQVLIKDPIAGQYTLSVDGTEVPMGTQQYYIVWEFFSGVDLSYPIGGEGFYPGEDVRILWEAVADTGAFQLDYTTDGGANWSAIATVAGDQRFYENWVVPNDLSGDVRVRITRGADTSMSHADLGIIGIPQNLDLVRVCPNEIRLAWDSVPGALSYTVHKLGAMYMDSVGTASTHVYDLTVPNIFDEMWWAVTAHGPDGARSRRAVAVFYAGGGLLNCSVSDELSATQINSPNGSYNGCFGVDTVITVQLANLGINDLSNFPVGYSVNGGTPVTETYPGTLSAGSFANYTFTQPFTLDGSTIYDILAWSALVGDVIPLNDTTSTSITVITSFNVPDYNEDFESFAACSTDDDCGATVCPLGGKWYNATNGSEDEIDWRVDADGTPSLNTGPAIDHNPGTSAGQYVYLEASNGCSSSEAWLISPCVDLAGTTTPTLQVWYHMYGNNIGELHVDVYNGNSWILDIDAPIIGDQGNSWQRWDVDLSAYVNTIVLLRIRGITGPSWASDIALDDIHVVDVAAAPVISFTADKVYTCVGDTITLLDSSLNVPTAWAWTITPSTFNYVNGTSAISQYPQVVFTASGIYTVELSATNGFGTNVLTQTNYIEQDQGTDVVLEIATDRFGAETTWEILDGNTVLKSGGPYQNQGANGTYWLPVINMCLPDDRCLDLVFYDSWGDGMCCDFGNGQYLLTYATGDTLVLGDGQFTLDTLHEFCPDVNSISENGLEDVISLFPNPNNGQMTLHFDARLPGRVAIDIVSVSGAVVKTIDLHSPEGNVALDLNALSGGMYSLMLKAGDRVQVKRFVIQK